MMIKKIVIGFLLVNILQSCLFWGCKKNYLTDNEKAWFKNFKVGQIFEYKSMISDSIIKLKVVENVKYFSDCNQIEISHFSNEISRLILEIITKKNDQETEFSIDFEKTEADYPCEKNFRALNLYTEYNSKPRTSIVEIKNIKIKAFEYVDSINCESGEQKVLSKFFWSKEYGLVKFETNDGDIFELQNFPKKH